MELLLFVQNELNQFKEENPDVGLPKEGEPPHERGGWDLGESWLRH